MVEGAGIEPTAAGVMSPARGHLPLNFVVRAAVIETAASTMATSRSAD